MAAVALIDRLKEITGSDGQNADWQDRHRLWQGVDYALVHDFIRAFRNNDRNITTQSEPVAAFISEVAKAGSNSWDVAVVGVDDPSARLDPDLDVRCQNRTGVLDPARKDLVLLGTRNRVSSRGVEAIGLSQEQRQVVKEDARARGVKDSDFEYRKMRERPLLVIQPINLTKEESKTPMFELPLIAWGISFPQAEGSPPTVQYAVNGLWWKQYIGDDDRDEELDLE
jgi:hypothetical protein